MGHKRGKLVKQEQSVTLNAEGIDRLSALLAQALVAAGTDHKDIVRLRLAMEDILMLWRNSLGEGAQCLPMRFPVGPYVHRNSSPGETAGTH